MDTVVDQVIFTIKFILVWIVDSIKAILPNGVLPKKSIVGDVVVVTGAGSGLGRLMSIEFAKLGALVALWDVNEKGNEETKKMVEQAGGKAIAYTVDLSKKASIYEVAEKTKNDFQRVDILVNNAGIVTGKKLFDCPDELMELTMAVNTNALFFTAKAFLPSMLQRNHGHLVTIASMAGKTGAAGLVDYCASKHGAVGFHESITAEIHSQGKDGVKTTCVCPYYIDTGMFDGVETFAPNLLPILQPQYVVDQIIESVLTDKEVLLLPKFSYMVLFFSAMLPSRATRLFADYLGVNNTMDHFKGRTAKKTA